jgi:hypothetical protein
MVLEKATLWKNVDLELGLYLKNNNKNNKKNSVYVIILL